MSEPEYETDEREADFILLGTVTVQEFLDSASGERSISVETEGDMPLTTWLGNLEYAKWELLNRLGPSPELDDEDERD